MRKLLAAATPAPSEMHNDHAAHGDDPTPVETEAPAQDDPPVHEGDAKPDEHSGHSEHDTSRHSQSPGEATSHADHSMHEGHETPVEAPAHQHHPMPMDAE